MKHFTILALLAVLAVPTLAKAAPCDMGRFGGALGMGPHHIPDRLAGKLGLSDEQRTQVQDITGRYREQAKGLVDAHRESLCAFRDANPANANYTAITQQASVAASALAGDMVTMASQLKAELSGVLTDEQMSRWQEMREKRMHRKRGEHSGRHGKKRKQEDNDDA